MLCQNPRPYRRHPYIRMRSTPERLAELKRRLILDSSPEKLYDDIVHGLSSSLGVPIVTIGLLDEHRDWFKAAVGTPLRESPASTSFCDAFFEIADDMIVVEDTLLDHRFSRHPMVVGVPHVRFYAAARLQVNGNTVGTLCAYDVRPRQLSPKHITQLKLMAEAAMDLLRRRAT